MSPMPEHCGATCRGSWHKGGHFNSPCISHLPLALARAHLSALSLCLALWVSLALVFPPAVAPGLLPTKVHANFPGICTSTFTLTPCQSLSTSAEPAAISLAATVLHTHRALFPNSRLATSTSVLMGAFGPMPCPQLHLQDKFLGYYSAAMGDYWYHGKVDPVRISTCALVVRTRPPWTVTRAWGVGSLVRARPSHSLPHRTASTAGLPTSPTTPATQLPVLSG